MLPSQYGPAGPSLLANGGRAVAGHQPIDQGCVPPTVPHRQRQRRKVQDARECNAIVRYAPRPSFFIPSTVSFSLLLSHAYTLREFNVCMLCCSVGADAVTPLRGPSPRVHTHVSKIRVHARVGTLDPLRARARRLAFFIRISVRPT